jgi:saccharopine dehydrogenase-like NADP-dependent oxidoreductase
MGFGDHYLNVFNVLKNIGLLSELPVKTAEGLRWCRLKVFKAVLPDPASLAPGYTGHHLHWKPGQRGEGGKTQRIIYLQHLRPRGLLRRGRVPGHLVYRRCAARRRRDFGGQGHLEPKTMVNVEELNPDPFIALLDKMGLPTEIEDRTPKVEPEKKARSTAK